MKEGTFQMVNGGYMREWKNGKETVDMPAIFDVSYSTVMRCVGPIAEQNGMNREELLKQPHSKHTKHAQGGGKTTAVDFRELIVMADSAIEFTKAQLAELHEFISQEG